MLDGSLASPITLERLGPTLEAPPIPDQPVDAYVTAHFIENDLFPIGQLDLLLEIKWKNRDAVSILSFSLRSGENEEHGFYQGYCKEEDAKNLYTGNSPHGMQPEKIAQIVVDALLIDPVRDRKLGSPERLESLRGRKIKHGDFFFPLKSIVNQTVALRSNFNAARFSACMPELYCEKIGSENPPQWWLDRVAYLRSKEEQSLQSEAEQSIQPEEEWHRQIPWVPRIPASLRRSLLSAAKMSKMEDPSPMRGRHKPPPTNSPGPNTVH